MHCWHVEEKENEISHVKYGENDIKEFGKLVYKCCAVVPYAWQWQHFKMNRFIGTLIALSVAQLNPQCFGQSTMIFGRDFNPVDIEPVSWNTIREVKQSGVGTKGYIHDDLKLNVSPYSFPNLIQFKGNLLWCNVHNQHHMPGILLWLHKVLWGRSTESNWCFVRLSDQKEGLYG